MTYFKVNSKGFDQVLRKLHLEISINRNLSANTVTAIHLTMMLEYAIEKLCNNKYLNRLETNEWFFFHSIVYGIILATSDMAR